MEAHATFFGAPRIQNFNRVKPGNLYGCSVVLSHQIHPSGGSDHRDSFCHRYGDVTELRAAESNVRASDANWELSYLSELSIRT